MFENCRCLQVFSDTSSPQQRTHTTISLPAFSQNVRLDDHVTDRTTTATAEPRGVGVDG